MQRQRDDGGVEIAVDGELDLSTAAQLRDALFAAIDGQRSVWLDLSTCSFIDSTGLRVIIEGARMLAQDYERLGISGLRDQPKQMFELTMISRSDLLRFEREPA